ncbi:MAG: pantetheine-phosphate adenylyltransferase [Prevotella sp.]|nr:pantetheine-phosphate adenylyltransferase [Prevotella sp.]
MKTALFTGTFDPFTIGHADIVRRALALFDHIIIGVAVSELKHTKQEADQRLQTIKRLYDDNPAVEVVSYSDLTVNLAKRTNASCIIRGVRSVKDFEYERDQAEVNRQLGSIETLLLFADPQTAHISSTLVRELQFFGQDVSKYLP